MKLLRDEPGRYDPCACGSRRHAGKCCWREAGRWSPVPSHKYEQAKEVNSQVSGCYARHLGDCGGPISKEHYFSKNILDEIAGDMAVSGLPWMSPGEARRLPVATMVGNVLCKHHNSALSALDTAAGDFFRAVRAVGPFLHEATNPDRRFYLACGEDLEHWLLKTFCGIFSSGITSVDGKRFETREIEEAWVEVLFKQRLWPSDCGLYIPVKQKGVTAFTGDALGFATYTRVGTSEVLGAKIILSGMEFALVLDPELHSIGLIKPRYYVFQDALTARHVLLHLGWADMGVDGLLRMGSNGMVTRPHP